MPTPQPTTYSVAAGKPVHAGRAGYPHALLDLIAAAPDGSWVLGNTNMIQSVFPATDFIPLFGAGPGNPSGIVRCWSGFGWDSRNHRLVIFGGGHANYSGNDTYVWDATTRLWSLAFLPSDVETNASGHQTVDGPLHAPISAHTYSNNNYLPRLDRFVTFGGAAHSSGNSFLVTDESGVSVRGLPGGYTLALGLSGHGFVGGADGSNVKRGSGAGVSIKGANAWTPRDYLLDHPQAATAALMTRHVNFHTAYADEGGKDVLYVSATNGGTNPNLFRIAYSDPDNYMTDSISQVGRAWTNAGVDTGGDFDPINNAFVYLGNATYPIFGWDLDYAGASNNNFRVAAADITGPGAAEFLAQGLGDFGLTFDRSRGYFVAWERGGRVYKIVTPLGDPIPTTGWYVEKIASPVDPDPRPATAAELGADTSFTEADKGVQGKWKYAPDLDCYVALQGSYSGNVWLFKPADWADPRI